MRARSVSKERITASDHCPAPSNGCDGGPVPFGLFERLIRIDGAGHTPVGNAMGGNGELGEMGPASRAKSYGRAQDQAAGSRDRLQTFVVVPAHPWHDRAIIETDNELGAQFDAAAYAAHQADKMRTLDFRRHEIGDNSNAAGRLDRGFENQRMAAIRAGDL